MQPSLVRSLLWSRISLIWLILIGATALSWAMGHGMGFRDVRGAGVAIIVIAFVKVRFVLLDFMEVRHAPLAMRAVGEAWTLLICTLLVILFLVA